MEQQVRIILSADARGFEQATAQGARGLDNVAKMAAKTRQELERTSVTARTTAREAAMVAPQLTDVFVGLQGGQNPLTVLLQQGGQLKDMFGGVGNAAGAVGRTLASMITPTTLLAGGVTAMVAAFVAAEKESNAFAQMLASTGNYAALTSSSYAAMTKEIADSSKMSISDARSVANAMIGTGKMTQEAIQSVSQATLDWARATGKTADDSAKYFSSMADGVYAWAEKHNQSTHFARAAQLEHIKALEESGQKQQAMVEVGNLVSNSLVGQTENVGYLTRAWRELSKSVSNGIEAIKSIGKESSNAQKLAEYNLELAALQRRMEGMSEAWDGVALTQAKNEERRLQGLIRDIQIEERDQRIRSKNRQVDADADAAKAKRMQELSKLYDDLTGASSAYSKSIKQIDDAYKAGEIDDEKRMDMLTRAAIKYGSAAKEAAKPKDLEAEYRKMVRDTLANRAPRLADIEAKGYEAANRAAEENLAKSAEQLRRSNEQAADYGQQLMDQTEALNISMIQDDRQRGMAQIELERKVMQARIDAWKAQGVDVLAVQDALNANIVARQIQLNEQLKPEWQRMLDGWKDSTRMMQQLYDNALTNIIKSGEDAFVKLAMGQKVDWKAMTNQIMADVLRDQYRRMLAPGVSDFGKQFLDLMGMSSTKGYSGNEKDANFMGPLSEAADASRAASLSAAKAAGDWTDALKDSKGEIGGFAQTLVRVIQYLNSMASSSGGGSGGGLSGLLSSLFGGSSGGDSYSNLGGSLSIPTDVPGMSLASGTNRMSRNQWMFLHEGEAVIPKVFNPYAGGGGAGLGGNVTIHSTLNMPQGVDRAQFQAALDMRDAMLLQQIQDQLRRPGSGLWRAGRA